MSRLGTKAAYRGVTSGKYLNEDNAAGSAGGGGGGSTVLVEEILASVLPSTNTNFNPTSGFPDQHKITTTYGDGKVVVQHRVSVLLSIIDNESAASLVFSPNTPFPPNTYGDGIACRAVARGENPLDEPMYLTAVLASTGTCTVQYQPTSWGLPSQDGVNYNAILDFFYEIA